MVKIVDATSIGQVRQTNQDYVQIFENKKNIKLAIVADGMGGHQAGDIASSMAVKHLGHAFVETDFKTLSQAKKWLQLNLNVENEKIIQASDRFNDLKGMGTTVVLAVVFAHEALFAHLGDSRAYLLRQGTLRQITEDHSLVNELLKAGEITPTEAKNHPQKNIITQTLGVSRQIEPEYNQLGILSDDLLLLCTDGLTNSLTDQKITEILTTTSSLEDKSAALIAAANKFGGQDNITVCLISYEKVGE